MSPPPSDGPRRPSPLSYLPLVAGYLGLAGTAGAVVRSRHRPLPQAGAGDVVMLGLATFRLSRLVTKDKVTRPVREPFVRTSEPGAGGEVNSEPEQEGVRGAVGELLTCPFCISVWIATGLVAAYAIAPRATRLLATGGTAVAIADLAQYALQGARNAAEG